MSYLLSSNSYLYFTDEEIKQLETVENVQSLNSSSDVSQSRFYASKNLSLHQTICVCTSGTMSFHNFSTLSSPNLLQHKAVVLNQVHPPPQTHTCTRTRAHTHTTFDNIWRHFWSNSEDSANNQWAEARNRLHCTGQASNAENYG